MGPCRCPRIGTACHDGSKAALFFKEGQSVTLLTGLIEMCPAFYSPMGWEIARSLVR